MFQHTPGDNPQNLQLGSGVRPAYQNPYRIYDQNLRFFPTLFMTYLLPDQKFDTLILTRYPPS